MSTFHLAIREFSTLSRQRLAGALVPGDESRFQQLLHFFETAEGEQLPPDRDAVDEAPIDGLAGSSSGEAIDEGDDVPIDVDDGDLVDGGLEPVTAEAPAALEEEQGPGSTLALAPAPTTTLSDDETTPPVAGYATVAAEPDEPTQAGSEVAAETIAAPVHGEQIEASAPNPPEAPLALGPAETPSDEQPATQGPAEDTSPEPAQPGPTLPAPLEVAATADEEQPHLAPSATISGHEARAQGEAAPPESTLDEVVEEEASEVDATLAGPAADDDIEVAIEVSDEPRGSDAGPAIDLDAGEEAAGAPSWLAPPNSEIATTPSVAWLEAPVAGPDGADAISVDETEAEVTADEAAQRPELETQAKAVNEPPLPAGADAAPTTEGETVRLSAADVARLFAQGAGPATEHAPAFGVGFAAPEAVAEAEGTPTPLTGFTSEPELHDAVGSETASPDPGVAHSTADVDGPLGELPTAEPVPEGEEYVEVTRPIRVQRAEQVPEDRAEPEASETVDGDAIALTPIADTTEGGADAAAETTAPELPILRPRPDLAPTAEFTAFPNAGPGPLEAPEMTVEELPVAELLPLAVEGDEPGGPDAQATAIREPAETSPVEAAPAEHASVESTGVDAAADDDEVLAFARGEVSERARAATPPAPRPAAEWSNSWEAAAPAPGWEAPPPASDWGAAAATDWGAAPAVPDQGWGAQPAPVAEASGWDAPTNPTVAPPASAWSAPAEPSWSATQEATTIEQNAWATGAAEAAQWTDHTGTQPAWGEGQPGWSHAANAVDLAPAEDDVQEIPLVGSAAELIAEAAARNNWTGEAAAQVGAWQQQAATEPAMAPVPSWAQVQAPPPPAPPPPAPPPPAPAAAPVAAAASWAEAAQSWGEPAPAETIVPGDHRIVLHTLEGSVKRGVASDIDLSAQLIALANVPGGPPAEVVPFARTKALFFMLAPGEKPPAQSVGQRRVKVTFVDGRQVEGFLGDEAGQGFFLLPLDARTNTARVFVLSHAVRSVV